jgi:AraC-like DNA-binding protein
LQDISPNNMLTGLTNSSPGVGGSGSSELSKVLSVLSAADELAVCREANSMLRLATELARERLGLERVGLYMRDRGADRIIMRGTWGTGARGETTDERSLFHEVAPREYDALLSSRLAGGFGMYRAHAPWFANEAGRSSVVIGEGWVMATPLVAAGDVVGVMYNDSALTSSPVDEGKQAAAAIFCTLLAVLYLSKRGTVAWQPLPRKSGQSPLVERILRALSEDLPMTGERLAGELGVSPGHLARSFKREMGVSLVDYRNRLRIDRFFESIHRSGSTGNLLDAALEAGFGSYAQFHRVYRKFLGTTPREIFSSGAHGGIRTALGATDAPAAP